MWFDLLQWHAKFFLMISCEIALVDESLVTRIFAKTFKYTCSSFKQMTVNVTNQESHKVLCHIWM
jgi:hypothetical protein